jgi:D-3-phosphoglycerate dehydrogenase / 2-oxoglutarate reductase
VKQIAVHTDAPMQYLEGSPEAKILGSAGVELRGRPCKSEDETIELARDADAILNGMVPLTRRVIQALPRTRVIARYGVGFDNVDLDAATEAGIAVVYVPDYCVEEVSNQALALLLDWARQVSHFDALLRSGKWGWEHAAKMQSVHGQHLGIVGAGRIGMALARKASALAMDVCAFDPVVTASALEAQGVRSVPLDVLLAESDYVSLHTPLMAGTRHLIGAAQLAKMKRSAFLINTSRGPVIDEKALIDALREGRIAGAGLDVFEQEPLPADSALRSLPNTILTPHVGAQSPQATLRLRTQVGEEVMRALRGELPRNIANTAVRAKARLLGSARSPAPPSATRSNRSSCATMQWASWARRSAASCRSSAPWSATRRPR